MQLPKDRRRVLWFRALLAGGAALALTMLVQTVIGYRYVTGNLLLQEARREGQQVVRQLEETVRWGNSAADAAIESAVNDAWRDRAGQAAWIVIVNDRREVLAARGRQQPLSAWADFRASLDDDRPLVRFEEVDGTRIVVGAFPCRCSASHPARRGSAAGIWNASYQAPPPEPQPHGPTMVEIALYPNALSAPFARVRRQAAINALTAVALLGALIALAFRFRGYVRDRQMEAQLDAAGRVQRELMPIGDAHIPGVEVASDYMPASQVGGDLVDVLPLPGGRVGFMLGDVSGKGVSAALLMGLVQGAMRASASGLSGDAPELAVTRVNDLLAERTSGERFASMFWCSFNPATATLRYVNAGHPPAFVVRGRSRKIEPLADGGPVLVVIPGAPYASGTLTVEPGDLLVAYSDGIAEAADRGDEEFGIDRVAESVVGHATSSARGICDAVLEDVVAFAAPGSTRDNRTLLIVRFTTECRAFVSRTVAA